MRLIKSKADRWIVGGISVGLVALLFAAPIIFGGILAPILFVFMAIAILLFIGALVYAPGVVFYDYFKQAAQEKRERLDKLPGPDESKLPH